jgi:hypothetical protein
MKLLPMMIAAATLFAGAPVQAQQIDLTATTCKDLLSEKESAALILMWLEACYRDHSLKPIVDFDSMKASGIKLNGYCGENPDDSVAAAADAVMAK